MADARDRDGNGKRRRRRGPRKEREKDQDMLGQPVKPIILAKHPTTPATTVESAKSAMEDQPIPSPKQFEHKPVIMLKSRDDTSTSAAPHNIPISILTGEATPNPPSYQLQRHPASMSPGMILENSDQSKLAPPPEMVHSVKLVDENLLWIESGIENLLDNTDFLVVGVVGLQGVGKSTILSLLGGNKYNNAEKQFIFKPQSREARETCCHQTSGIDMFVTSERIILLDTQPILSSSVLDRCIRHDKKYAAEYSTPENYIEIQSLQVISFLLTVCNMVLVAQDWFLDSQILRFLNTAEMLKPAPPSSISHESSSINDETPNEYFAHIAFVQNKATREDFTTECYKQMQSVVQKHMQQSKLKYTDCLNMASNNLIPGVAEGRDSCSCNIFLIPNFEMDKTQNSDNVQTFMPEYRGYPSVELISRTFRNQILSLPRCLLTHTTLSEKNWFHYAARTWDTVKKSQMIAEYNRLLP